MFRISADSIDRDRVRASLGDTTCGACVTFEGWIRNHNDGRQVLRLEYEVYRPLAEAEGRKVVAEALERYTVEKAVCVHREGPLEIGELAVIVAAVAHHRAEAFEACRYIIDEIKHRLPIWKKEHYADGETAWVNFRAGAGGAP